MNRPTARLQFSALALLLGLAVTVSYAPALKGGFIWDDESYVTENTNLRSAAGLRDIWLSPGSSPQYYPLVFTSFWAEYRLWGLRPLGFHLTNVALHLANALLLWWLLRSLAVPGAWLAAAIWGLHPVNVESVAWITERKNVLSGIFYLATLLLFVRPGAGRDAADDTDGAFLPASRARLLAAYGCFFCALLSKTVTATLPLALVLLWWWKGISISARRLRLLAPLFAAGAGLASVTLWMEKYHVGAQGDEWALTLPQRFLVAGRALWFYAGKLLWPADLAFIYPRWDVQGAPWAHYLYPAAAAAVIAAFWLLRRRLGRGPLAAVLFFGVTLAPALGFIDYYPMRFSFVADHFAYLASIGIVVPAVALLHRGLDYGPARISRHARDPLGGRSASIGRAAAVALLVPLALLTWRQSGIYLDLETLWRDTIRKNPGAWMTHNNLGVALADRGQTAEAIEHYLTAVKLRPDFADGWVNLGDSYLVEGRTLEAIDQYLHGLRLTHILPKAHTGLGAALGRLGRAEEARAHLEEALRQDPKSEEARFQLALIPASYGDPATAERRLVDLLQLNPSHVRALLLLGDVLSAQGRATEALQRYREASRLRPDSAEAHNRIGVLLADRGERREAEAAFVRALSLKPDFAEAAYNLGRLLDLEGRRVEAVARYRSALAANPRAPEVRNNLGVDLILLGDVEQGLDQLREALRLSPGDQEARRNLQLFEQEAAQQAVR